MSAKDNEDYNDPLNKSLGIGPMSIQQAKNSIVSSIVSEVFNDSAKADFEFSRANIKNTISNSSDAIAQLSQLAAQGQDIKAFEALSKLFEVHIKANKELLELQKQIRNIDKPDERNSDKSKSFEEKTTNNLFVGTTADILKLLENKK